MESFCEHAVLTITLCDKSLAPDINKVKQAEIKIGKILVGGAIKENVTCICVWGFYKNDLRCVVWF